MYNTIIASARLSGYKNVYINYWMQQKCKACYSSCTDKNINKHAFSDTIRIKTFKIML